MKGAEGRLLTYPELQNSYFSVSINPILPVGSHLRIAIISNATKSDYSEIDNVLIVDNKGENQLKRKYHTIDYYPRAMFDSFMDLNNESGTKK